LIKADGKPNSVLSVCFFDGKWQQVGIGASLLAKELGGFLSAWPAAEGYSFRYVKAPQASSDFIELSNKGKVLGFFPLSTMIRKEGRTVGEFKLSDLRDPQDVLTELRSQIKRNIETNKQNKSN
jgi:hypothetical protein